MRVPYYALSSPQALDPDRGGSEHLEGENVLQEGVLHGRGVGREQPPSGFGSGVGDRVRAAHKASPVVSETSPSTRRYPWAPAPPKPEDWLGLPPSQGSDDSVCGLFRLHSVPSLPPFDIAVITAPFARVFCGRGRAGVGKYTSKFTTSGIVIKPRAVFCTSLMKGSNKTRLASTLQSTH